MEETSHDIEDVIASTWFLAELSSFLSIRELVFTSIASHSFYDSISEWAAQATDVLHAAAISEVETLASLSLPNESVCDTSGAKDVPGIRRKSRGESFSSSIFVEMGGSASSLAVGSAREDTQNDEGSLPTLLVFARARERSLLICLFRVLKGPLWDRARQVGWRCCERTQLNFWNGVTTSNAGLVTRLNLERNANMEGILPSNIGELSFLTHLTAYNTKLHGNLPASLSQLSKLMCLRLNNTLIDGHIPPEIGHLTSLRELWLNDTRLTGCIPPEIGQLTHLEMLDLSASALHADKMNLGGIVPRSLCNVEALKKLYLQRSRVHGALPSELGNLVALTHLYIFDTNLKGPIPASLGNCKDLMYLHLNSTDIEGPIPASLGGCFNLEELYLSMTNISGSIPDEIGDLTNLKRLWLSDTQLVSGN